MLYRETVAVYCENHMEHTDTLCGRMQSFGVLKRVVHIVTRTYLAGNILRLRYEAQPVNAV
jgi:hypothetical protein